MKETINPTRLQRERRANKPLPQKPKGRLERYLKYAPLAYLYLIVYSYVGLDTYYSEFGIKVLGYMSVQEVLVLPLENLSGVVINLAVTLGLLIIMILLLNSMIQSYEYIFRIFGNRSKKSQQPEMEDNEIDWDSFFDILITLIIIVSLRASIPEINFSGILKGVIRLFINFLLVGVPLIIVHTIWYSIHKNSFKLIDEFYMKHQSVFRLMVTGCTFIYVNHLYMLKQADDIIRESVNQVKIELKDPKRTNTQALLLGATNSSIFLLDTAARETFVIPKSEIRELRYLKDIEIEDLKADSIPADTLQQVETDTLKLPTHP